MVGWCAKDKILVDLNEAVEKMQLPDPSALSFDESDMSTPCQPLSKYAVLKDLDTASLSGFAIKMQAVTDKLEASGSQFKGEIRHR